MYMKIDIDTSFGSRIDCRRESKSKKKKKKKEEEIVRHA